MFNKNASILLFASLVLAGILSVNAVPTSNMIAIDPEPIGPGESSITHKA